MSGRLIEEDLFIKYSIVDSRLPEGQKIHAFLAARAKALAGKYIDFDKTPVTFVLSDTEEPNAFFAAAPDHNPKNKPKRSDYETTRFIKNPLETPVICITRGLLDMVDNLDELDFVLGHELTHMIMRQNKIKYNSKGEEEIADLHAVDLVYDAGGDPKQALVISEKISAYIKQKRDKLERKRYRRSLDKEDGINWSEIFDVHMTDSNRKAGIEASLTRLSHLIDDRQPTGIDKKVFEARYNDPVDSFLKANHYIEKNPEEQLKILIDCIDHLSIPVPAAEFFQAALDALPQEDPENFFSMVERQRKGLQDRIDAGYIDYFRGPVVEKKYQQKIANLAEGIFQKIEDEKKQEGHILKSTEINCQSLNIYLQNRAYKHIDAHGYPVAGDLNYRDASGILYSYFYCLIASHQGRHDTDSKVKELSQIEADIKDLQTKIREAKTANEFIQSVDELDRVSSILREIKTINYGPEGRGEKLDNLSPLSGHRAGYFRDDNVYGELQGGSSIPWNNLVEIAKTDDQAKERIVQFLKQNDIEDFRITHDLPYIRSGYSKCYRVENDRKASARKIQEYELDFAVKRDLVLQAYDYISQYFENESSLIEKTCSEALNVKDSDFKKFETTTETFNRSSSADKKIYDFVSLFNALPANDDEERQYGDDKNVVSLIPERHQKDHPIPGSRRGKSGYREETFFEFSKKLLSCDNPVFQRHFGDDFEEVIVAKKESQQQKMFATAIAILERCIDIWLEAKPKLDELRKESSALLNEIVDSSDEASIAAKKEKRRLIENECNFYNEKEEQTSSLIYNFFRSIFSGEKYWYQLKRLKPEQKRLLAELAVRDEKGAIIKLFCNQGYELFCDYLGILEEQTKRVMSGDYRLTEWMKIVGNNHGYQSATTREELKYFVSCNQGHRYSRDNRKYAWYMHVFESMEYLEKTPDIDIYSLAVALTEIEQDERSSNGGDPYDIIEARYSNYKQFLTHNHIMALIARAVDHQDNYKNLSIDELLQTADALISMRGKFSRFFEAGSSSDKKPYMTSEQRKFLNLIDKNIKNILIKIEYEALQQNNALEKMTNLYRLYNGGGETYSSENKRESFLTPIIEGGSFINISVLSQEKKFWPDDALEHVKAFVFAKNTFLDDKDLEDQILNDILSKIELLPSGKKKNECLFILLDKNLRAPYPETREKLFAIYSKDILGKLGKDDGSEKYQKRLTVYVKALESEAEKSWDIGRENGQRNGLLSNSMSSADKYLLMRRLSDAIVSQEKTSLMIKESCQIKLNSEDMLKSYLYGIGVDYLTEEMDRDAEVAKKFIEFFNSKGEKKDCHQISAYIENKMRKKYPDPESKKRLDEILHNTRPTNCKILYENFWAAPLEARAVIIARMLKSAANNANATQHSWERVFDLVMDNLISPNDSSIEARYARDIMHSYIKSRSDYERELIMSAMMVANRNIGNDKGNIGKALKLFLENMGPAEIKLGQAIASHPDTPESIKVELQKLKSSADIPARWTLYDWIRTENIPEELWKDQYLGEIQGSASYYTTVILGEDEVLRILRPEAREKAAKGFKVIRSTVEDLKEKEAASGLDYKELTSSVQQMVIQAARMSDIETDHESGQRQYEYAVDIYDGVTIACGKEAFACKVMDWRAKGKNWIIMDRAKGMTFNALPDNTPEQFEYKRSFAKSYVILEVKNILSGKKFDHDKHGAQLSIDPATNAVGIYDTGAMALQDPSLDEQRLLGNVVYDAIKAALGGNDAFSSFGQSISRTIDDLHQKGIDTQYLVEVKKGLLALGDFFKYLTPEDIKDILPAINLSTDVSEHVKNGITEKMTFWERAQYGAFLALQTQRQDGEVVIVRKEKTIKTVIQVKNFDVAPDMIVKSSWLKKTFAKSKDDGQDISDFDYFCLPAATASLPAIKISA